MKRAITIFLIGIMMLVMSACGWKPASDEIEMESESVGTTEEQDSSTSDTKTESSEDEIHYADLLPVTTDYFKNGEISIIDPDGGTAYSFRVANYQDGEYEEYIEACKSNGFDDVTYEGGNEGGIIFKESTKDRGDSSTASEESETPKEPATSEETSNNSNISPEFKEAMDSYEEFFNEYCEFMKKYTNSDDAASMLADYTDYMTKYTETMEKMDTINQDELSTAEVAYYTEVSARISQKLLEVAQ